MRWQVIAVAVALAWMPSARAQDSGDADLAEEAEASTTSQNVDAGTGKTLQERIRAVSRRAFLKADRFELTPHAGITANDPFFQSWAFGARGAWHFSEEFALDFGGAYAPFKVPQQIFRVLNADPEDLADDIEKVSQAQLIGYADAGVTFSPFYGKAALASEFVSHFDVFVSGGLAAIFDSSPEVFHPGLEVGLGGRVYLNRFLAARVDVRNYIYPATVGGDVTLGNLLLLNIGLAIYFPLEFDYSAETLGAKD